MKHPSRCLLFFAFQCSQNISCLAFDSHVVFKDNLICYFMICALLLNSTFLFLPLVCFSRASSFMCSWRIERESIWIEVHRKTQVIVSTAQQVYYLYYYYHFLYTICVLWWNRRDVITTKVVSCKIKLSHFLRYRCCFNPGIKAFSLREGSHFASTSCMTSSYVNFRSFDPLIVCFRKQKQRRKREKMNELSQK